MVVTTKPVSGVTFSQFRAKVSGTVSCLENCGLLQLSLSAIGRVEEKKLVQATQVPKGTRFTFEEVLPGKYTVTLHHDLWCWEEKMVEIEVVDKDVESVEFVQSGYILACSLSHDIMLVSKTGQFRKIKEWAPPPSRVILYGWFSLRLHFRRGPRWGGVRTSSRRVQCPGLLGNWCRLACLWFEIGAAMPLAEFLGRFIEVKPECLPQHFAGPVAACGHRT